MAVAGAQAERRDEPRQRRSGAAGRSAGARGAPRTAAVQGADRGARQTLSRVLTGAALPATVQGADRSPPPQPRHSRCPACLGRGGSLPLQIPPKCRVTLLANPTGPPLTEYKKKKRKQQQELEKCATSTRSESTCGRRSFSSGKAPLYGRSVHALGAAGLDCRAHPKLRAQPLDTASALGQRRSPFLELPFLLLSVPRDRLSHNPGLGTFRGFGSYSV